MSLSRNFEEVDSCRSKVARSRSVQGLSTIITSPAMKIPLPPRMWITDVEDDSSENDDTSVDGEVEKPRVRSRFRHHKSVKPASVPIGIFWDIENCHVPRGCSAIDVVAAIRAKFLIGRREADFVVVCDVRKESANRLQELNDAQISLIHVCGTQKNAADEKLRQCMRRFGELHSAPAALLLISGDINFAADLSDFRHRKNMEVILVHKQNTSSALIACASSNYCYNQLTAALPRNPKSLSQSHEDEDEPPTCEMEVCNLPEDQAPERITKRLRRLADNCGGKVLRIQNNMATLKFPTPDHASRALKRMDGEDVFGRKISTRYARNGSGAPPTYSSDEGYGTTTATAAAPPPLAFPPPVQNRQVCNTAPCDARNEWTLALKHLPTPPPPPQPHDFCPPSAPKPRKIRGTHGSVNLDRSGCSSSNSDDSRHRALSPWNSSASFSEQSEGEDSTVELTVSNLPPYESATLQIMLTELFTEYVPVVRVSVWTASDGPLATVILRTEWDARFAIARLHKRRLENQWYGRRLELSIGRPSPVPNLDVLRSRLRAILLDQKNYMLPLLRLRDAYASRHCCALTTSDIAKVKDTVVIHEGIGRMVQLVNLNPVANGEIEEAPWKCHIHATLGTGTEDGSRILQPVFMEVSVLANNAEILLENHGGVVPLLSFVECYEATFSMLFPDQQRGVALELLLRNAPGLEVKDTPSRHLTWRTEAIETPPSNSSTSESSRTSGDRDKHRTAPVLEPMLALFERELLDLLRTAPRCSIPFSKLIPAFHHHFGRQCRVADYGFTKLPDLLAALSNTIVVLGSGSSRVITLSAAAQSRRWTSDLLKILRAQPDRCVSQADIPQLYQTMFSRNFSTVDYGFCTLHELMQRVSPESVTVGADGTISLPRRQLTPEEQRRIAQFAKQTIEMLCYTANLRMDFSSFVPAYHTQFGWQLRVAHYGCVKLVELFEFIPETVRVTGDPSGERSVRLTPRVARPVLAARLRALGAAPIPLNMLPLQYAKHFGAAPQPDMLDVKTIEDLVLAAGGSVENSMAIAPGFAWQWARAALCACAALSADRSVARGSTHEYFAASYRRLNNELPDISRLSTAGVIQLTSERVKLAGDWRTVWRVAQILAEKNSPFTPLDLYLEYTTRYEPEFPGTEAGVEGVCSFLWQYSEIFCEVGSGRWTLCAGVAVPRTRDSPKPLEDYSVHDTPPGQKGSRVFESPKYNIWCSPPASALPIPTAFLSQEKRRTRLAAQFDA